MYLLNVFSAVPMQCIWLVHLSAKAVNGAVKFAEMLFNFNYEHSSKCMDLIM